MFGLLPLRLSAPRFHDAWLLRRCRIRWRRLAATGASLEFGGPLFDRRAGLAFQADFEHLLGQDVANLDHEIFELRQLGAPRGPVRSPEAVGEVFGNAFEVRARFFYLWTPFFVACHPWLPVEVKAKLRTG
jgi:hypothetical protein